MDDVTARELTAVFSANMKALRIQRGLTQTELADQIQISQAALSRLESGINTPSLETVAAVAAALGVAPSLLLTPEIFASAS